MTAYRTTYAECVARLRARLAEPAPGRIQLLAGPRQVGKTTLLLELSRELGASGVYAACDSPETALPGFWQRLWTDVERRAQAGRVVVLLDEIHLLADWAARLKGEWDRVRRRSSPIHVVATGSSALRSHGLPREPGRALRAGDPDTLVGGLHRRGLRPES